MKLIFLSLILFTLSFGEVFAANPDVVTNLSALTGTIDGTVNLTWTVPTASDTSATAVVYTIRYSTKSISSVSDFTQANLWTDSRPVTGLTGMTDQELITGLAPLLTYYFCLTSRNSTGEQSGLSNLATTVPAGLFLNTWELATSDVIYTVAWGDYDNDGYPDLLAGNKGQVSKIYRNLKTGTFSAGPVTAFAEDTWNVVWLDADSDGYLDMFIGNGTVANRLYRNRGGDGNTFNLVWSSTITNFVASLAVTDFNNDGRQDLLIGNFIRQVQIYRNDGNNTFTLIWTSPSTEWTRGVASLDFDDDGDYDFLVANQGQATRLYRNDGNFQFTNIWSTTETDNTWAISVADFDNDGYPDFALGNEDNYNRVYRNTGNGTFNLVWSAPVKSYTRSLAWGDYDNDGWVDLAVGNSIAPNRIYRNNRDNTFTQTWSSSYSDQTWQIAWADFDLDSDLDFATSDTSGKLRVYSSYFAQAGKPNTIPNPPTSTLIEYTSGQIYVKWSAGQDIETVSTGLCYNLRISTVSPTIIYGQETLPPGINRVVSEKIGTPIQGNYIHPRLSATQLGIKIFPPEGEKIYYATVQTIDTGLRTSSWTTEKSVLVATAPAAVTDLVAAPTKNMGEIILTWTAPGDDMWTGILPEGSQIKILYTTNGTENPLLQNAQITVSTANVIPQTVCVYSVTSLTAGVTYYFRLWTADEVPAWSAMSNQAVNLSYTDVPPPPDSVTALPGDSQIILNWTSVNVAGPAKYHVYVDTTAPADNFVFLTTTTEATYTHQNLVNYNTYYYRIQSVYTEPKFVVSDFSVTVSTFPRIVLPRAPTGFTGTAVSTGSIIWTWLDNAEDEDLYRIFSDEDKQLSGNLSTNTTFWTETGLSANISYYRYPGTHNSYGWAYGTGNRKYTLANPPVNSQIISVTYNTLTISWLPGTGGNTRYCIDFTTGTNTPSLWMNKFTWSDNLTQPTVTLTGLTPETPYFVRIAGYNGDGILTVYDNIVSTVTLPPPPDIPSGLTGIVSSTFTVLFTWQDNAKDESGYRVKWATTSLKLSWDKFTGSPDLIPDTTYWQLTGLQSNTQYTAYVETWNLSTTVQSNSTDVYTLSDIPVGLNVTDVTDTSLILTWLGNGTSYLVERADKLLSWQTLGTVTVNKFNDTGLTGDNTYWYLIFAYNGYGIQTSTPSEKMKIFTAPKLGSDFNGMAKSSTSILWTWSDVSQTESGYRIYNEKGVLLSTIPPNSIEFWDNNLQINSLYTRQLEVYNNNGTSKSVLISRYTSANPISGLGITQHSANFIGFAWETNNNPDGTTYEIQWSTEPGFGVYNSVRTVKYFTTATELIPNTSYWIRVTSYNYDYIPTAFSVTITTMTLDVPPVISGRVVNMENVPIPNAKLELYKFPTELVLTIYTQPDGTYEVRHIPDGVYSITVTKDNYEPGIRSNVLVSSGMTNTVNFVLTTPVRNELTVYDGVVNPRKSTDGVKLGYYLTEPSKVKVQVYSSDKQMLATLVDVANQPAGAYLIKWDLKDSRQVDVGSGIYFVLLDLPTGKQIKKVIVVK